MNKRGMKYTHTTEQRQAVKSTFEAMTPNSTREECLKRLNLQKGKKKMSERQMLLTFALKFLEMNFWASEALHFEKDPVKDTIFFTYERKDVEAMICLLKEEGLIEMATDISLQWCEERKLGLPVRISPTGYKLMEKFRAEFGKEEGEE